MRGASAFLADIAVINPTAPKGIASDTELASLPMAAVSSEMADVVPAETVLFEDVKNGLTYFEDGDILVAKITPCFENGKIALVRSNGLAGFGSTEFHVVRVSDRIDRRYLIHFLRQQSIRIAGEKRMTGSAGQKRVPKSFLEQLEIPLPPLEEQRRIAAILDAADALRAKRRAALAKLDTLAQSIFFEMFGDVRRNPEGWAVKTIGDLCKRVTVGIVVKPASYYQEAGVPAVRGTNIKADGIDLSDVVYFSDKDNEGPLSKTRIWKDDLVIVRSGRPGLTAIVPDELDGVNAIDILIATPDQSQVAPRFLCTLLNSPVGRALVLSESRGQVQQHFNVKSLAGAEIAVPSIDLQRQFCRQLDQLDTARINSVRSMEKVEALFLSLQHRAFRGELTAADEKVAAA